MKGDILIITCVCQTLLLKVMDHKKLLETNDDVMLQQKLALRAPYITPLNILQVSTLATRRGLSTSPHTGCT